MENKGLIFIPDISGYTRFVNQMEIEHCRLIIQELLETLINSNKIELEVSEIEGDAILFYKFGGVPDMTKLYEQVEKMFVEFHKQILAYDQSRYCQCPACNEAIDLTLKVISHYGEFTGINIKSYNKLIGKDIIIAHQLLKNDIDQHEYWLVTKNLKNEPPEDFAQWMKWNSSFKKTESGEIPFYYTQLGQLKNEIEPDPIPKPDLLNKNKIISVSKEYETGILKLFHLCGDFNHRSSWQEGVKKIDKVNHFLPRVGMRSKFILDKGVDTIRSTSYSFDPERIEFTETSEKTDNISRFLLEKIGDNKTRLTIEIYGDKNIANLLNLFKKKNLEKAYKNSLENLEMLVNKAKA